MNNNSGLLWRSRVALEEPFLLNRVVRKPFNAKPGLEVNRSISLSCMKMFFTAYVLCGFRFFKLKTERQTIYTEKFIERLQN